MNFVKNNYKYLGIAFVILMLLLSVEKPATAQRQSGRVYEFINLPATARITALGGYALPTLDNDLGMALFYPAMLDYGVRNQLSLNFADYFSDISIGTVAFSTGFPRIGHLSMAVNYVNYGVFTENDEFGNELGTFSASEYAVQVGWGRSLNENFRLGSNLKIIASNLARYRSFGIATDVALSYAAPERGFSSAIVFRNIGRQIVNFNSSELEKLPFDVVIGASKKLGNAPLRFSLVAHNLHNFDLTFEDRHPLQGDNQMTGGTTPAAGKLEEFADRLFHHMVFGVEFLPGDNFIFSLGYNYRRRQELKVDSRLSTVGLSWGIGLKINRFRFHFARANYHLAGSPNHFSITTNLDQFFPALSSKKHTP